MSNLFHKNRKVYYLLSGSFLISLIILICYLLLGGTDSYYQLFNEVCGSWITEKSVSVDDAYYYKDKEGEEFIGFNYHIGKNYGYYRFYSVETKEYVEDMEAYNAYSYIGNSFFEEVSDIDIPDKEVRLRESIVFRYDINKLENLIRQ